MPRPPPGKTSEPLTVRQRFLVTKNRGLAYQLALRFFNARKLVAQLAGTADDYVQEAMLALMSASRSFDPARKRAFTTYASRAIKNRLSLCAQTSLPIRLPSGQFLTSLARNGGVNPRTGLPPPHTVLVGRLPTEEGDHRIDSGSTINPPTPPQRQPLDITDERAWMRGVLRQLPKRERIVLRLYYGLDGEPLNFREIAPIIHTTHETARHVQQRAIAHLRALPEFA